MGANSRLISRELNVTFDKITNFCKMLTQVLQQSRRVVSTELRRNFGVSAPALQAAQAKVDPIQALFLDKVREYAKKSKAAGGKLLDATPEVEKDLQGELDKLNGKYGVTGPEFLKFPTFTFSDKSLAPVGRDITVKEPETGAIAGEGVDDAAEEALRPWWKARS